MAECSIYVENNERFIVGSYNGLKIYIREKDGYVNASKLCKDSGREFKAFNRTKRFKQILKYYNENEVGEDLHPPIYELNKGYNIMKGQYITPDLIHFVAEWISIEYSFKVKHIMDTINDIGKAKLIDDNTNMEEVLNNLNKELEEYKTKNKELIAERNLNRELI